MGNANPTNHVPGKPARISYGFVAGALVLIGWLHLATPLLAVLFAYLALTKLHFLKHRGKWAPVVLFIFVLTALAYGFGHLINQTVQALPEIAKNAIPSAIEWAKGRHIELPFSDYDSLKDVAMDTVKNQTHYLGSFAKFARGATTELVFLIVGCVVDIGLFLNPRFELDDDKPAPRNNLYTRS